MTASSSSCASFADAQWCPSQLPIVWLAGSGQWCYSSSVGGELRWTFGCLCVNATASGRKSALRCFNAEAGGASVSSGLGGVDGALLDNH